MSKRTRKGIKVIISMILVFTLFGGSCVFADTDDDQNMPFDVPVRSRYCPVMPITRGSNMPTTVYSLNDTYWGTAYYSVGVYTNCLFKDHNGAIRIQVTNTNDIPDPDSVMQVKLCHKNFWGSQITDASVDVNVHGSDTLVFSDLNTNTKYFFQFTQIFQTYPTTTSFTIQRAY